MLVDVHHAVDDAPEMYALIRQLADRIEQDPGQFDRETSTEAGALLRWLADGNFMILGHAAYSANELARPTRSARRSRSSGVLRGAASISPLELLPAFRSGAPAGHLQVAVGLDRAPLGPLRLRHRHHAARRQRPATASPIHVFLGLITDETDGTVGRVPVVRKRIAEVLCGSGARANSHTGRQLLAALRTLPRDELLEAPTRRPAAAGAAGRRPGRAQGRRRFRPDAPQPRLRHRAGLLPGRSARARDPAAGSASRSGRTGPARIIGRDDRIVELGLARMQFLIALRPGEAGPESRTGPRVEAEVARVTRRWSDDLADLLHVGAGGAGRRPRLLRRYAGAFPEAYKEDFGAPTAVLDLAGWRRCPTRTG